LITLTKSVTKMSDKNPWYKTHVKKLIGLGLALVGSALAGLTPWEDVVDQLVKQLVGG